jgi:hypothetical protein
MYVHLAFMYYMNHKNKIMVVAIIGSR